MRHTSFKIASVIVLITFLNANIVLGHSGNTDDKGGHWDRSDNTYHYHTSGSGDGSGDSSGGIDSGAAIVIGVILGVLVVMWVFDSAKKTGNKTIVQEDEEQKLKVEIIPNIDTNMIIREIGVRLKWAHEF